MKKIFTQRFLLNPKMNFLKFALLFGGIGLVFFRLQRYTGRIHDNAFPGAELLKLVLGSAVSCIPFALIFAATYWGLDWLKKPTSAVINYWHWMVFLLYFGSGTLYGVLILIYDIEGPIAATMAVLAGITGIALWIGLIANLIYAFYPKFQEKFPNPNMDMQAEPSEPHTN